METKENTSGQRNHLSVTKQALLQKWKRGEMTGTARTQAIARQTVRDSIPLSFMQQRLWFIDQLVPGSSAYNISHGLRFTGLLNVEILQGSLNEIVRRHEILRTSFPSVEGNATQLIAPSLSLQLPIADLSALPETERETTAWQLAREEARQPFDLAQGPLIRTRLLRLDEHVHILLFTLHHTICDGWSLGVLLKELAAIYEAYLEGKSSPLPELPIQYADFALWQREWLQGEALQSQLAYWKQRFEGVDPFLRLPTDRPRPPVQTFRGSSLNFEFSAALSKALKTLSQQEDVTQFMTLLAGFKTLLYRYTGQKDIIVGIPIANRQRVELENLIGFFANTLALRTTFSGDLSFQELQSRVRETAQGAYAHQDLPFEYLVEALHLERNMSHNPLFQVIFNFGNTPNPDLVLPHLKLGHAPITTGAAIVDLWLSMGEREDGILIGTLEYNSDIFEAASMHRLMQHFQILLVGIVADPTRHLADLPLLTTAEQDQLLVQWNSTQQPYPLEQPLSQLIEAQVERTPEAIAVVFEEEHLTYQALNQRANHLAYVLQGEGVGPDELVGICMERSLELVIGLLAILKAGGAYVPLEPGLPQQRLNFLLEDTGIRVLLTQHKLKDTLGVALLCLDADGQALAAEPLANPGPRVQPDHLAYVLYTSGSTGQPKGAMNRQRSIVNRLLWMQQAYHLRQEDRVLHKTPISFDVSLWELFWPLLTGACLVVARPEGHRDSRYLVALIREQQITTLHFVPSLLHVLLEERDLEACTSLRRVICSGEALDWQTQQRWYARLNATLSNLYGPTEAAVDVTWWICERESQRAIVPIGKPIANTQIYLLDERLRPVPIGAAGELYIGGVSLARGYLNRPELTAERFVPHPLSAEPGERLYKTGDLARYLPPRQGHLADGAIEFLGRVDTQVKIHGMRIELGEIESSLRRHPDVQDAVVLAREDVPGDKRLVAYVVLRGEELLADQRSGEGAFLVEQMQHWRQVFDETYREPSPTQEPALNLAGWNSSYTGLPIPTVEMRDWVQHAVDQLLSLHPSQVLEIGCGTGLLLLRIAPYCSMYTGTDFSSGGLENLHQHVKHLPQVTLLERRADDFTDLPGASFDTIILNSVVQYFPSVEYLLEVLEGAMQVVEPGGTIFVGDVRNLALLEAFHTSVELYEALDTMPIANLRQWVQQRFTQESELVIDPAFFFTLKQRFARISQVEVRLKRGRVHNELTRFRYDAILHIKPKIPGSQSRGLSPQSCLDWQEQELTIARVHHLLTETAPEILHITHVPNARLTNEIRASELLMRNPSDLTTVGDLRKALGGQKADVGVDPEDILEALHDLPYAVTLQWSGTERDGSYSITFCHHSAAAAGVPLLPDSTPTLEGQGPPSWQAYANNPLRTSRLNQRIVAVREHLKESLPEYMVPAFIMPLEALPLTTSGKIDRKALPEPGLRLSSPATFVAPHTPLEETLAGIWKQVLGLERISITENFFEIGGNSIRSIQIVSRASAAGLRITPRLLFQYQTIAELAEVTEVIAPSDTASHTTELQTLQPERNSVSNAPLVEVDWQKLAQRLEIDVSEIEDAYPLTPMQQNMLFQRRFTHNHELYRLCLISTVKRARINLPAFERAWQQVVDQHPTMRTLFVWEDLDEPLQVVLKHATVQLEHHDWRGLSQAEQDEQKERYFQGLRQRGNPLTRAPHIYIVLAQLTDEDYYQFFSFNYMLMDGWSLTLRDRDFIAFYEALCSGQTLHLEPPRPYREYIAWLQRQDLNRAEAFWRKTLEGFTPSAPLANRASLVEPRAGDPFVKETLTLSAVTTTALQALARKQQLTLATLINAAWALTISHCRDRENILFGYFCASRPPTLPGSEYMLGFFPNILPIRIQILAEMHLMAWLRDLQVQMVELREFEYTPLMKIKEWMGLAGTSLPFESYLVIVDYPLFTYEGIGEKARQDLGRRSLDDRLSFAPTEYPLRVDVMPRQQLTLMVSGYECYCTSNLALRLIQRLKTVLEGMVADPTRRLGELLDLIEVEA